MHPKAEEAQRRHEEAVEHRKELKRVRDHIVMVHNLRFWHRQPERHDGVELLSGMTVAYQINRRNVITVSTTLLHPNDQFNKLTGEAMASTNFDAGCAIHLRMPAHYQGRVTEFLRETFRV